MKVTRKILFPTLAFFALVLIGLSALFGFNLWNRQTTEANAELNRLNQALASYLAAQEDLAIGLASEIASSPQVQTAFANDDRQQLTALTTNQYQNLQSLFEISHFQFHNSPAIVYLSLDDPDNSGEDQTATRTSIVTANINSQLVSGLELSADGLAMLGIAPVSHDGKHIGTMEVSLNVDRVLLSRLRTQYAADWNVLVSRKYAEPVSLQAIGNGPIPELQLLASTMAEGASTAGVIFSPSPVYEKALDGETSSANFQANGQTYAMLSVPLRDSSTRVIGVMDIIINRSPAVSILTQRLILISTIVLASLVIAGIGIAMIFRIVLRPIQDLTEVATAIAQGQLDRDVPIRSTKSNRLATALGWGQDEIGLLAESFSSMTHRLRDLVDSLEGHIAARTQDLERRSVQLQVAAEVARDITTSTDLDELLSRAVDLVRQRFEFYHVGIFLIDQSGEYAVLSAATGQAGKQMLANSHRLKVGQVGIVGAATGTGTPRIALDVGADAIHFRNPLLPDTRSEMALPLRIGERVIGALDVQSRNEAAFDDEDITILGTLSDQLATAIENARLIRELNQIVLELEQAYGRFTKESWGSFAQRMRGQIGYRYVQAGLQPINEKDVSTSADGTINDLLSTEARQAVEQGQVILLDTSQIQAIQPSPQLTGAGDGARLAVPIKLREQVIGVLNLRFDTNKIDPEMISLIEDAASRMALVLESGRLLQEAQRLAAREQQINVIASQVRTSVNFETILQNTVRELGKALGASRTTIQIGRQ